VDAFGDAIVTAFGAGEFSEQTFGQLGALDEAGFTTAAESLLPDLSNNASTQVYEAVSNVGDIVNRRIVNTIQRSGTAFTAEDRSQLASNQSSQLGGTKAEQAYHNVETGFWLNGSYRVANQDNTNSTGGPSNGYDSDIISIASGFDFATGANTLVGVTAGYSSIETDLDRSNAGQTDLDAYHVGVYAAHREGAFFVSGQLGYTSSDVEAVRSTNLGFGTIRSDFDVDGFSAQLNVSYDISLGGGGYLAPLAGIHYSSFSTDDFVEDGGLDLLIDVENTDVFEGRLGFLIGAEKKRDSGSLFDVYGKAAYVTNFSDSATNIIASFGTQNVVLQGLETIDERVELGAGFTVHGANNLSVGASIDGEVASDYSSIGGTVRVKFRF
jgi:hypothetical protein